jgi:hypothetical protein
VGGARRASARLTHIHHKEGLQRTESHGEAADSASPEEIQQPLEGRQDGQPQEAGGSPEGEEREEPWDDLGICSAEEKLRTKRAAKRNATAMRKAEKAEAGRLKLLEGVAVAREEGALEGDAVTLPVHIYGHTIFALMDTGATGVYMSKTLWDSLGRPDRAANKLGVAGSPKDAQGNVVTALGVANIPIARLCPGLIIGMKGIRQWRMLFFFGATFTRVEADAAEEGLRNVWHRRVRSPTEGNGKVAMLKDGVWIPARAGRNVMVEVPEEEEGVLGIIRFQVQWQGLGNTGGGEREHRESHLHWARGCGV